VSPWKTGALNVWNTERERKGKGKNRVYSSEKVVIVNFF
jgi:hypothetical protein